MAVISHWACDEGSGTDVADEEANHNGTMSGASWTNDGTRGWIYESTTTNNVDCGDIAVADTMTWAFWINTDSFPVTKNYILSKYVTTSGNRSFYISVVSDGHLNVNISTDGSAFDGEQSTTGLITTGAGWQHVIITFDAGAMSFYIDNVVKADSGGMGLTAIKDNTTTFFIGSNNSSAAGFDGQISDVYIFSHVATSQERADLFADTFGATANPKGPFGMPLVGAFGGPI